MPLRSLTFLACFFGSTAASLAYPMAGVLCYIVVYHVYPQTTWWGEELEFLGIRYSFTCGLCLLIGTGLNLNRLRFGRRFLHPLEWGFLLVLSAMLLSAFTGAGWDYRTDEFLDKMAKVFVFIFAMTHVVVTRARLWQLYVMLTLMALYLGHEATNAPPGAFIDNRLNGIGGPDFQEAAGLAIHLFALLPFAAVLLRQKPLWTRVLAFFASCYAVNGILLCRARSAFLAGIIAGVTALWYIPRRHRRWVMVVLALGLLGGTKLSDHWFRERMKTIFVSAEERDTSAQSRFIIWSAAWRMVRQHPLGVGIGHFEFEISTYLPEDMPLRRDAHNSYVLCLAETGFAGLAAYVAVLGMAWLTLTHLDRKTRKTLSRPDMLRLMIFANRLALLVYLIAGVFVSRLYTEGIWMFLAMPICLSRAIANEVRSETCEAEELRVQLARWFSRRDMPQLAP